MKKGMSYDLEANKWSKIMLNEKRFFKHNKLLIEIIKKNKKKTLLDVGCGSGIYSIYFADINLKVTGIDISKKMIEEAKKNSRNARNPKFFVEDLNKYSSKKKFGVITCFSSLHNMNLKLLKKSLSKLFELLESEGILLITMRRGKFEGKRKGQYKDMKYYRYSHPEEIKNLLRQYNLKWVKTYYVINKRVPYFTTLFIKVK